MRSGPLRVTGCRDDASWATDGLPSTADAPLQDSELTRSAKSCHGCQRHGAKDKVGTIFEYARYSNSVRARERDEIAFTGIPEVIQDYEANLKPNFCTFNLNSSQNQRVIDLLKF